MEYLYFIKTHFFFFLIRTSHPTTLLTTPALAFITTALWDTGVQWRRGFLSKKRLA